MAQSRVAEVDQWLKERQIMAKVLQANLKKAQNRMKFFADKHRTDRELEVGDWIYLKLQPYKQTTVAVGNNLKLTSKFYGPYKVINKLNAAAYELLQP